MFCPQRLRHCDVNSVKLACSFLNNGILLIRYANVFSTQKSLRGHCSLSAVTHAPFRASLLRPASQAGPIHEAAWMGKLVNVALLSLINEACVNVCCAIFLSSELVGPACVQARSINPRGRACRPSGKGSGRRGY